MAFKININANIKREILNKILERRLKLIRENVRVVMRNKALPHLIDLIMKGYDELTDRAAMGPDDPTNPANWRSEFLTKLREELEDNLIVTGNRIIAKLGDRDFLGYDPSGTIDTDDTEPLHWLVFYLEGLIGDWAFITREDYNRITGGKYDPQWGRFGQGFMISKENYQTQGWDRIIPFDQVRHPFSGFAPLDIFTEALNEFKIRPFIQKALDAAVKGEKI